MEDQLKTTLKPQYDSAVMVGGVYESLGLVLSFSSLVNEQNKYILNIFIYAYNQ